MINLIPVIALLLLVAGIGLGWLIWTFLVTRAERKRYLELLMAQEASSRLVPVKTSQGGHTIFTEITVQEHS